MHEHDCFTFVHMYIYCVCTFFMTAGCEDTVSVELRYIDIIIIVIIVVVCSTDPHVNCPSSEAEAASSTGRGQ